MNPPTLVCVFGAGASFDSTIPAYLDKMEESDLQYRPPLAKDLFENRPNVRKLIQEYLPVAPLAHMLAPGIDDDVTLEARLQRIQEEAVENGDRHMQLMALRFYLRDLMKQCTNEWSKLCGGVMNYRRLVDEVVHLQAAKKLGKACYVTFNYDGLLDQALEQGYRRKFESIVSYAASDPRFSYIKLHGSYNWVQVLPSCPVQSRDGLGAPPGWLIENAAEHVDPSQPKVVMTGSDFTSARNVAIPALAIPVQTKDDSSFMVPKEQLDELRKCLAEPNTIFLLIGWQAQEAHFLKMWAEARGEQDTRVFIVDKDLEAGKVVGENVKRGGLRRIDNHVYEGKLWKDRSEYDFNGFQSFSRRDDLRRIVGGDHHWTIYG